LFADEGDERLLILCPVECAAADTASSSASSSSSPEYDVVLVGLGAMGLSTAYHLAKRGQRVIGLERFTLAHAHGSSHGETRITRLAYWEHPDYVPLLRRSFTLFSELDTASGATASGRPLFQQTGSIDIGPAKESIFLGSVLSCREHGLEHEIFRTPEELKKRFPAWEIPQGFQACFQPAGGMLFPERVLQATGTLARSLGAVLREHAEVTDVIPTKEGGVEVHLRGGEVVQAKKVVLSAGAWLPTLLSKSALSRHSERLARLATMLKPERQVVTWYAVKEEERTRNAFQPENHPVWVATWQGNHYYVSARSTTREVRGPCCAFQTLTCSFSRTRACRASLSSPTAVPV
jgi:sarcosine oxidase